MRTVYLAEKISRTIVYKYCKNILSGFRLICVQILQHVDESRILFCLLFSNEKFSHFSNLFFLDIKFSNLYIPPNLNLFCRFCKLTVLRGRPFTRGGCARRARYFLCVETKTHLINSRCHRLIDFKLSGIPCMCAFRLRVRIKTGMLHLFFFYSPSSPPPPPPQFLQLNLRHRVICASVYSNAAKTKSPSSPCSLIHYLFSRRG